MTLRSFPEVAPEPRRHAVVIAGSGPSAHALALGLGARGVRPTVVAPGGLLASDATLCAFVDQLPSSPSVPGLVDACFERTVVHTGEGLLDLQRPYARLSTTALRDAAARVVDVVDGTVVRHSDTAVVLASGASLPAALVVDATGHRPALVRRIGEPSRPTVQQAAYGIVVDGVDDELPPGTALFMDWRAPGVDDGGPPSFLYALAFDDGRLLLEETTLASAQTVPFEVLERRLRERLRRRGTRIVRERAVERVLFPMAGALPLPHQPVVAFGAALGLVQPITGYSVARSLRAVDVVADAIARGLAAGRAPVAIADGVVDDVWTSEARMRRRLQLFGLDALCSFDDDDARAFFAAFFAQTPAVWRAFLDGTLPAPDLRRAMWRLFSKVPASVRLRLMRGALSPVAAHVASDALASVVAPVVPHLVDADAPAFGDPR